MTREYKANRSPMLFGALLLPIAAGLFYISDPKDEGILYFFVIPFCSLSVVVLGWLLVTRTPKVVVDGDTLRMRGKSYPLSEVALTDIEMRLKGRRWVRAFDILATDENGRMTSLEVNSAIWPDVDSMYAGLREVTGYRD